jgi:hypothetical protein
LPFAKPPASLVPPIAANTSTAPRATIAAPPSRLLDTLFQQLLSLGPSKPPSVEFPFVRDENLESGMVHDGAAESSSGASGFRSRARAIAARVLHRG